MPKIDYEVVGIGGVMAEVAWLNETPFAPVQEDVLLKGISDRYGVTLESTRKSVTMAEKCGVIERTNQKICLKARPR
jgi:hypothetical protein